MGTFIVGGGLLLIVTAIILNAVRRYHQGKPVLCDGVSCSACGSHAFCQAGPRRSTEKTEQVVRFVKRADGLSSLK